MASQPATDQGKEKSTEDTIEIPVLQEATSTGEVLLVVFTIVFTVALLFGVILWIE